MVCLTNIALVDTNLPVCLWSHLPCVWCHFSSCIISTLIPMVYFILKINWCFFPPLTGSVLLCWFTITFFPPNVLALSHSHIFGIYQYHTTTWLKTVNGQPQLLPFLNYCRPIILTTHNLLLITSQKSVKPLKNLLHLLLVYLPLWTQGYIFLLKHQQVAVQHHRCIPTFPACWMLTVA